MHDIIAYGVEQSFGQPPADTTSLQTFGGSTSVSDLSLDNAAERIRTPGDVNPWKSVFQNFEGAITVSFTLTSGNLGWLPIVFNATASPYAFQKGTCTTGRVYVGADPGLGTIERELMGVIFPQCEISFSDGENVTVELTGAYADEVENSSLTQGTPIQPSGEPFVTHSATVTVAGTDMTAPMQEATLSLNSQARHQTGFPRHPINAVMGGHECELEVEKILRAEDSLSGVGYGSSDATAPADYPDESSAVLECSAPGADSVTFNCNNLVANEYAWSQAGEVNEDTLENTTAHVNEPEVAVATGTTA